MPAPPSSAELPHVDPVDGALYEPTFPIVGIGASAGGLEALTALVGALTLDTMAFVVVQHMSPDRESLLPEILARSTSMPVEEIADGMRVETNHIYVGPPNANVAILHGVLHLMPRSTPLPIDAFFRSLSEDHGSRAVGVVLSGMGIDGTEGLKAIRANGGLTFCQDPTTARFDSMPRSAFESGAAHRSLPPATIGAELMTIGKHPFLSRATLAAVPQGERDEVAKLFILIRSAFGNDLSLYKPSSINRRIERRMALLKIDRLADYVRHAHEDHDELAALYRDILINVTSFFRDHDPFVALKDVVLPRILERKPGGRPIRLWVPACASGEEAYSLAICALELVEQRADSHRIQIFGTDVDVQAVTRARRGLYPSSIEADVSPERLERFFVKVGRDYQVSRRLRDLIVFSPQNVVKDSPFSRIDLLTCRNLLIYMQQPLQKRLLRLLHYALEPEGHLMLGTSETVGDSVDLFSLFDRKNKIYVKKSLPAPALLSDRAIEVESAPAAHGEHPEPPAKPPAARELPQRSAPPGATARALASEAPSDGTRPAAPEDEESRMRDLEQDLASAREYLQTTIEELETSNEELKSTNEELQSSNEELQSTNEELETSKEELQASNEELSTVNDELQHRVTDLWRSTTDLENLMTNVDQAILFIDASLRIRSATEAARQMFRLVEGAQGRPLVEIAGLFGDADVVALVRTTIGRLVIASDQARIGGRWCDVRAAPYRSPGGVVDGAIVVVRDASERGRDLVLDVRAYAEKLLAALPQPLAILDGRFEVLWVNTPFLEVIGVEARDATGESQPPGASLWAHPGLREAMVLALATGQSFRDVRVDREPGAAEGQVLLVSGSVLTGVAGADRVLLLALVPIDRAGPVGRARG